MMILTGILGPLQVATFSTLILFISSESRCFGYFVQVSIGKRRFLFLFLRKYNGEEAKEVPNCGTI